MTATIKLAANKLLIETKAIDSVRLELANAKKRGESDTVLREIHSRLISLYASFDVHNVESIIQSISYAKAS